MKQPLLTSILSALVLVACSQAEPPSLQDNNISTHKYKSHTIPLDSAINNLESFLSSNNVNSRAKSTRTIKNAFALGENTNSRATGINVDTLIYIVNFENNEGYAILAGDDRVESPIISIVDEGNLDEIRIDTIKSLDGERPYVPGFPADGLGFYTIDGYGDEIFMNPNTVNLYIPEENDHLVGNFNISENDTYGNDTDEDEENPTEDESGCPIPIELSWDYAYNSVVTYEWELKTADPENGTIDLYTYTKKIQISPWQITSKISPLLNFAKDWHQKSPFNDLHPKRRSVGLIGHQHHAPVGCFPLAIAKVMTTFELPSDLVMKGEQIDWSALKHRPFFGSGLNSARHLLYRIGDGCDCWYFYYGTFTFPNKAKTFMKRHGFPSADICKYSEHEVFNMLDQNKPVIIYSIPGINIFKSHAWNIDGYIIQNRDIKEQILRNGEIISETNRKEKCSLFHCDFGWKGKYNGYYIPGVFKLNKQIGEYDDPNKADNPPKTTNYNNYLHIIRY